MNRRFAFNSEWNYPLRFFLPCLLACVLFLTMFNNISCKRTPTTSNTARFSDIRIESIEGEALLGHLFSPQTTETKPAGLILLHMEGNESASWSSFAQLASNEGFMSVAYDQPTPWHEAVSHVRAAKEFLIQNGANPSNLFIIGAGAGANVAITYAQQDPAIQGTVLVSAGVTLQELTIDKIVAEMTARPVLFLASEGDSYAHSSALALKETAPVYSELKIFSGSMRGTDLLDAHPSAALGILRWLAPIVAD